MKKSLLLVTGLFAFMYLQKAKAQNLVANSNFSQPNNCREFGQPCAPAYWFGVPAGCDYYTPKLNPVISHAFCGFVYYSSDSVNTRTFITTQLLCPLVKDSVYIAEMLVFGRNTDKGKIGIYLPAEDFLYETAHFSSFTPAAAYWQDKELTVTPGKDWQKLQLQFTATGKERYLVIGNFMIDIPGDISTSYSGLVGNKYYYFIDNVVLRPANKNIPFCNDADAVKQQLLQRTERHGLLTAAVDAVKRKKQPVIKADTLTLPDVLFDFNKFSLNKKFEKLLDSLTSNIGAATVDSLQINGYTDNKGSDAYNKTLSLNRAKAVADYLLRKKEVPSAGCRVNGFGSSYPVAENTTAAGRLKNRRVEIIIFKKQIVN
jgi:outer membrane protein OmpA-like peptidoglycan-associated protein